MRHHPTVAALGSSSHAASGAPARYSSSAPPRRAWWSLPQPVGDVSAMPGAAEEAGGPQWLVPYDEIAALRYTLQWMRHG